MTQGEKKRPRTREALEELKTNTSIPFGTQNVKKLSDLDIRGILDEIKTLHERIAFLFGLSGTAKERSALSRKVRRLGDRIAAEFALRRGWTLTNRRFTVADLKTARRRSRRESWDGPSFGFPGADHPYFFLDAQGRPAAVAAHNYDGPAEAEAFASRHGLDVETPDFPSWYFEGRSTLFLFSRRPTCD